MNGTLTDNVSSFNNQSKNSKSNKGGNYIAFTSVVKSEYIEEGETLEDIKQYNSLNEESEDNWDTQEVFD